MAWKNRLQELADERRWSLRRLARELGMQPSSITRVVNGASQPSLLLRERVRRKFPDINVDRYIYHVDDEAVS